MLTLEQAEPFDCFTTGLVALSVTHTRLGDSGERWVMNLGGGTYGGFSAVRSCPRRSSSRYASDHRRALPRTARCGASTWCPRPAQPSRTWTPPPRSRSPNSRGDHWRASSLAYQWKAIQLAFTASLPEGHWIAQRVRWAQEHGERGGHFTWHELRHTGATQFLLDGVSHEAVARQLGYATAEYVLETYGHVSEWDAAQEVQRIYE